MTPLREKMVRDMQLRRLSDNTQRVYTHAVFALARHYMKAPDQITTEQVQAYVLYMLNERKLTWSTCDTNVAGLKFFYGVTLGRNSMRLAIPPRKSEKRLPEILERRGNQPAGCRRQQPQASRSPGYRLQRRASRQRTDPPQNHRHRLRPHDDPRRTGQGEQRPLYPSLAPPAPATAGLLAKIPSFIVAVPGPKARSASRSRICF